MEKTRVSLSSRIKDFFKSLSTDSNNDLVEESTLTAEDKKLLKKLREIDNVEEVEKFANMREELKVKSTHGSSIKVTTVLEEETVEEVKFDKNKKATKRSKTKEDRER